LRLNHRGATGTSDISRAANLAIVRRLLRSWGKSEPGWQFAKRYATGWALPTTRQKTCAKWLELV